MAVGFQPAAPASHPAGFRWWPLSSGIVKCFSMWRTEAGNWMCGCKGATNNNNNSATIINRRIRVGGIFQRIIVPALIFFTPDLAFRPTLPQIFTLTYLSLSRYSTTRSTAGFRFNPDNPLGGSPSLRECWRSVYGLFAACPASIDQAMDFSQPAKLSRNLPRHHLAS